MELQFYPGPARNQKQAQAQLSAKSRGVRLVSAKHEINQINDKDRERKIKHKLA
jgi:hypothetical protein